jgi:hypothetical protein
MPIQVDGALPRAPCPVPSCPACEPNTGSVHPNLPAKPARVERGRHCYAIKWLPVPTCPVTALIRTLRAASSGGSRRALIQGNSAAIVATCAQCSRSFDGDKCPYCGAAVVHLRQIRPGHPAQKSALNCYQNNSPELPAS